MTKEKWFLLTVVALCITLGLLEVAYYAMPPKGPFVFQFK
jgi:hypothetical protein